MRPLDKVISMEIGQQAKPKKQAKKWEDMTTGERATGLIVLGVVVLFVIWIISAIIGAASHTSNNSNATTKPASSQTQTTQSQPAATQTAQPTQPSIGQQVATWNSKYGHIFSSLETDYSNIGTDGKNEDATSMNTDCKQLQKDVTTAQSYPAIPDPQTANDWSSALSYSADSAQDCIDGTANYDATLITKSGNELNQATTKIEATATDINKLNNQ